MLAAVVMLCGTAAEGGQCKGLSRDSVVTAVATMEAAASAQDTPPEEWWEST